MKRLSTREIEPPSRFAWCEPCGWREEHHRDDQSVQGLHDKILLFFLSRIPVHWEVTNQPRIKVKFGPRFAKAIIDMFRVSMGRLSSQSTEASVLIHQSSLYRDTTLTAKKAAVNITVSLESGKLARTKASWKKTKQKAKARLVYQIFRNALWFSSLFWLSVLWTHGFKIFLFLLLLNCLKPSRPFFFLFV